MHITQQELKNLLNYDPYTGVFTWLPRGIPLWDGKWSGKVAGTLKVKGNGYRTIRIHVAGKICPAHRLAWLYMTGENPPLEIDHKNRDATDNRWENIRNAAGNNQKNKSMQRNNKSGITGVSWSKQAGKWSARVWDNIEGKRIYKHLGTYEDLEDAGAAVKTFREGRYDPEHGKFKALYILEQSAC